MKKITYLLIASLFIVSLSYAQSFNAQQLESTINGDIANSFSDLQSQGVNYNFIQNIDIVSKDFTADTYTIKASESEGVKQIQISYREDANSYYSAAVTSIKSEFKQVALQGNISKMSDAYVSTKGNYYLIGQHTIGSLKYYDIYVMNAAGYKAFMAGNATTTE